MLRPTLAPLVLLAGLGFVACQGEVIVIVDDDGGRPATSTGMGGASSGTTVSVISSTSMVSTSVVSTTTATVSTTTATSTSTGGNDCLSAPDCFGCFCDENPSGCEAYITGIIENIYCGDSCELDCTDFCAAPDVEFPGPTCESCVNGGGLSQADIDAFIDGCTAAAGCAQFFTDVQDCPF